ncbi:MAG: 23S rRNA (pseudouridine(1915)-N(3))-methyltransferase RlmH [Elusimicrobiota bacterium]
MWASSRRSKLFGSVGAGQMFSDYVRRLDKFCRTRVEGGTPPCTRIWLCDRGPGSRMLSSEQLCELLGKELSSGVKSLEVVIGPAEGLRPEDIERLRPALRWSFGPATLPHELAAVVAAEQLYRAWCILRNIPYHK